MEKINKRLLWITAGYELFGHEGLEGIQIERIARIVDHNKSSFYHYFGDVEGYFDELIKHHVQVTDRYNEGLKKITTIDPEFIQLLVDYKVGVMFHAQLLQMPDTHPHHILANKIDQEEDVIINKLWSRYLDVEDNPDLAVRYLDIIRSTFYGRMDFKNFTFQFLQELLIESKAVMAGLTNRKNELEDRSSY